MALQKTDGVWPVMLTPFTHRGEVDYESLARLITWYEENGAVGLVCLCQSSEIFYLTLQERIRIAEFVKRRAHIPVIASGHTAYSIHEQMEELNLIADTGVDGLVMISNRFGTEGADNVEWHGNMLQVLQKLPGDMALGFYECPYPFKKLLELETVQYLSLMPQMRFLKDTCCDKKILKARLDAMRGSRLKLFNANSATLLYSLREGAAGYSGVMANFHPELYVWLCENFDTQPEAAEAVQALMTMTSDAERHGYPAIAKSYMVEQGIFSSNYTRVCSHNKVRGIDVDMVHQMQKLVSNLEYELSIPANRVTLSKR